MTQRNRFALLGALLLVGMSQAQTPDTEALPAPKDLAAVPAAPAATATVPGGPLPVPAGPPGPPAPYALAAMPANYVDPGAWWVSGAYMMGWLQGRLTPPLVTTGPAAPMADAGVIGAPGTRVLFGGPLDENLRSGGRAEVGYWFARDMAISMGFFFIDHDDVNFFIASDGTQVLARPFVDAELNQNVAQLVAFPNQSSGSISVSSTSQSLYGGHVNLRERFFDNGFVQADSILGYRNMYYGESLEIVSDLTALAGAPVPGTRIQVFDQFNTRNEFHGVDLGFRVEMQRERWTLELLGKFAVGQLYKRVAIGGNTIISAPNQDTVRGTGGLLALPTNIGTFTRTDWEALPEFGINFGWNYSQNICLKLGYNVLLFRNVVRAGDQIDTTINQNLLPPADPLVGPARPGLFFRQTDMLLQALNFGVECRF